MARPAIVVHGGAGRIRGPVGRDKLQVLKRAAERGYRLMEDGGSALDAVVEAVVVLEDSGVFNAGLGSCLTIDGVVEMDAGVMDGETGGMGAVAAVRCVKNPVILARKVMELTDHVLLAGEGAEKLAELLGLKVAEEVLVTPKKLERLKALKEKWEKGEDYTWLKKLRSLYQTMPGLFGTVGAVAVDSKGRVAAATSTGGYWLKMRGRVGDSPIPGAGFYAVKGVGACSATGIGEAIIRFMLCKVVCELMESGMSAAEAAKKAIEMMGKRLGDGLAGVISVDYRGGIGYAFNTPGMLVGFMRSDMEEPQALVLRRRDYTSSA